MPHIERHIEDLRRIEHMKREPPEPSLHERIRMVRDHAIGRYYDRHIRTREALPPLADVDEQTGPDDMKAFQQWYRARQAGA